MPDIHGTSGITTDGPEHKPGTGQGDRAYNPGIAQLRAEEVRRDATGAPGDRGHENDHADSHQRGDVVAEPEGTSDMPLLERARALYYRFFDPDGSRGAKHDAIRLLKAENDPENQDLRNTRAWVKYTRGEAKRALNEVDNRYQQIAELNTKLLETIKAVRDGTVPEDMGEETIQSITSQQNKAERLLQTERVKADFMLGGLEIDLGAWRAAILKSLGAPNTETGKLEDEMEKIAELRQTLKKEIMEHYNAHLESSGSTGASDL